MNDTPPYVYLIGRSISQFNDNLPWGVDVMRYYYHDRNLTEAEKIAQISNQISNMYESIGVSTIHFESIRSKVKRLVASVKNVVETRKSARTSQIQKEHSVFGNLMRLFEVTHNEHLLPLTKRDFLIDQRTVRQMLLSSEVLRGFPQPSTSRGTTAEISHLQIDQHEIEGRSESIDSDEFQLHELEEFDNSPDFMPYYNREKSRKIQLTDNQMKQLSKCGGSFRTMEKVLSIGIEIAGGNPKDYSISKTSLCDTLSGLRSDNTNSILEHIASSNEKIVIQFDEKKFAKINAKHVGKDSRLVVLCHTPTKDVALGLPILESGDAESITTEIIEFCENYNLTSRVIGLACDTTNVNTGEHNGVCVRSERALGKDLFKFTCRHHISEVLLSSAFYSSFGGIAAPTITIFDQLKVEWLQIKKRGCQYTPCDQWILDSHDLRRFYNDAKETLLNHSKSKFIRDDYAELNDLCLKLLGIDTGKTFMVPGSVSKARWMAKAIYGIKMYLFREELDIEPEFQTQLLQFSLFVTLIYCKYWNRCTIAFDAAVNDLLLINELEAYTNHNEIIANSVLNSFRNHLWYLGEELAVLSIFSDKVSLENKNRMRLQLTSSILPIRSENSVKLRDYVDGIELPDLLSHRSRFLFSTLELETDFCHERAETWNKNSSYKKAKELIKRLAVVVNDEAERALGKANTLIRCQKVRSEERFQKRFVSLYS